MSLPTKIFGSAALAVMVIGPAVAVVASPTVRETNVQQISPVDDSGKLASGFTIHHRYGDASCESGSPTVGKAYQCFTPKAPNGLYNSCWVATDHHFVLCVVKPWQHKVDRLHVTRGYGDSSGFLKVKRPWGLRLANGDRCLVILGPVHTAHGKAVNYYCSHKGALAGPINEHHKIWTVSAYRKVRHAGHPTAFRPVGKQQVAIAWNGGPSQQD